MRTARNEPVTVVHVDDDPDFAALAATFLERSNDAFDVVTATSIDDGLALLADEDVDCIVSDYDLVAGDGIDFLETVREDHPSLPFILFTGKGSEEVASEAITAGVTDYLQKGSSTDQYAILANRIENYVAKYRAEQDTELSYRAIETAQEGIAIIDPDGTFRYVNQAYADTFGYEPAEMVGEHWELIYPEDHIDTVHEEILPEIPEAGRLRRETTHQRKDGHRIITEHSLAGTDEGVIICTVRDVTESLERREELQKHRERFELLVQSVTEYAIFTLDADGYVTSWNAGAERITGYERDDILGEHLSVFHPEETDEDAAEPSADELLERADATGAATAEGWRLRADGTRFWADVSVATLTDGDGGVRGFGVVARDMTEQHEREATIRRTQEQFDTLPDLFYVIDEDGQFLRLNEQLSETTGYTEAELKSMHSLALIPEEDHDMFRGQHERLLNTDDVVTVESSLITKDGRRIPHEFRRRRLTDADGSVLGFVGMGRDITKRKEAERERARHVERLNEFASVVTHDLKNPLAVAKGYLPTVEDAVDGETADHVERIDESLDRIEAIIDDVLEITRTGRPVTEPELVDSRGVAERMWSGMEKGAVNAELDANDPPDVMADPSLLERLFMNLFRNTVEHGDESVRVRVGPLDDGFYVEDDGPGIPPEEREAIFDWKFTTKEGGSGIGLKSVEQITHAHDWTIDVTEGIDGGARFEFTGVETP